MFLGNNLVSWSSKCQNIVSCSSTEAEYRAVANGMAEACWLRQLLVKLHSPLSQTTLVYCNNVSAVYLSTNPVRHQHTKHVEIDPHFVRDSRSFSPVSTSILLEDSCIRGLLDCVCIGLLGLVWGEAHPLGYIIVILLLESIEQPFFPSNTYYGNILIK
jgi:hypothetical protein